MTRRENERRKGRRRDPQSHWQQWDGVERYEDETPSASEGQMVRIGRRAKALRHPRGCARRPWPCAVPRLTQ